MARSTRREQHTWILRVFNQLCKWFADDYCISIFPFPPLRRARTCNLDVTLLFVLLPPPSPALYSSVARHRHASCCPFLCHFFPHPPTMPTQLAWLFIKTSKLTGFNRIRFTLVVTTVYYLLRWPIPATSFQSLILSHKSRPPKTPPPTLHSRCALSSASLSNPRHSTSSFFSCRAVYTIHRVSFNPS